MNNKIVFVVAAKLTEIIRAHTHTRNREIETVKITQHKRTGEDSNNNNSTAKKNGNQFKCCTENDVNVEEELG